MICCLTGSQCRLHKRLKEGQAVCHGGLIGKQDGQPSSEDVGDELIGNLVLKKEVHYSNQDVKGLKSEQHDLK